MRKNKIASSVRCPAIAGLVVAMSQGAAGCHEEPDSEFIDARVGSVTLITADDARVQFIDTGTSISVVEVAPDTMPSAVEQLIMDGASAREIFASLSPHSGLMPDLFNAAYAETPLRAPSEVASFRDWEVTGTFSSCWNWTGPEWVDWIEANYPGYDEYHHVGSTHSNISAQSDPSVRSYYGQVCTIGQGFWYNAVQDIAVTGWRDPPGSTGWVLMFNTVVPSHYRLRHWDTPAIDGYRWQNTAAVAPPGNCSGICNPGHIHFSHMWDW